MKEYWEQADRVVPNPDDPTDVLIGPWGRSRKQMDKELAIQRAQVAEHLKNIRPAVQDTKQPTALEKKAERLRKFSSILK